MRHIPKTAAPCKHVHTQTHTYKYTHMRAQTHSGKRPKVFSIFTHFSKSPPDSCFGDSITICSQGLKMNKHQQAAESATKNVIADESRTAKSSCTGLYEVVVTNDMVTETQLNL